MVCWRREPGTFPDSNSRLDALQSKILMLPYYKARNDYTKHSETILLCNWHLQKVPHGGALITQKNSCPIVVIYYLYCCPALFPEENEHFRGLSVVFCYRRSDFSSRTKVSTILNLVREAFGKSCLPDASNPDPETLFSESYHPGRNYCKIPLGPLGLHN